MTTLQQRTLLPCANSKCDNESRALCYCCQQNYCLRHLIEHSDVFNSQLNFLFNEINKLNDQIKALNIQQLADNCHRKLDQWRMDCHLKIDQFFEQKYHEFNRFIDEKIDHKRIEINRLQSRITELISKKEINNEEFDSLKANIDDLRTELNNLEQIDNQVDTRPLTIDNNLIDIKNKFNLLDLSPIYQTINHPHGNNGILANSDQFILIHLEPNLVLINKQLIITKQVSWPYKTILDMCWSSTLDRFLIIEKNNIYLVDEQTLSIENLPMIQKRIWFSCTCSDTSLFLSTDEINPSIMAFNLLPSIKLVTQWNSPYTCRKDECIDDIVYNNSTLAILIRNNIEKSVRLELRSSETLQRIWSFQLDIRYNQNKLFRCCSINFNEWLVADYQNRRLVHITNDGELKNMITYYVTPSRINLFGLNMVIVSRTNGINFHRI